ncbi:MAG: sulfatase [Planctomycetota bacterium]
MSQLRYFLFLVAGAAWAAFFSCSDPGNETVAAPETQAQGLRKVRASPHKKPNFLLLVLDTSRADYFSCYGHEKRTTPHIDALAAEGMRYEAAFSTCFWTFPSHASLLTGLYPTEAGATSETLFLSNEVSTLAEQLRDAGYHTGAIVRNPWLSVERGFHQGFVDYHEAWRNDDGLHGQDAGERAAAEKAVAWLHARRREEKPFFLFVNLNIAHLPYAPPEEVRSRFLASERPQARVDELMQLTGGWEHLAGESPLDDMDLQILKELYEADIACADLLASLLFDALKDQGLLDETVVIVTSDHGENIGEHGMIDHVFSLFDTTVRVPLIIRYPSRFPRGGVCGDLVSLIDVAPTVLDLCGALQPGEDTEPLRFSLCNAKREKRSAIFAENDRPLNGIELLNRHFPRFDTHALDHRMRMVRTARYKLIVHVMADMQLFDLAADPSETRDRSKEEKKARRNLYASVKAWTSQMKQRDPAQPFESRDSENLQKLRELGYMGE